MFLFIPVSLAGKSQERRMNMEGEEGAELFSTFSDKSMVVLVPAGLPWSDLAWGVSGRNWELCSHLFSTQSPFLQCLLPSLS